MQQEKYFRHNNATVRCLKLTSLNKDPEELFFFLLYTKKTMKCRNKNTILWGKQNIDNKLMWWFEQNNDNDNETNALLLRRPNVVRTLVFFLVPPNQFRLFRFLIFGYLFIFFVFTLEVNVRETV